MAIRPKSAKSRPRVEVKERKPSSNQQPAKGKLGIMIPGMGTVRLGKRTEGRSPKIKEFLPLAGLDDLVFTGWDIFEDDMYAAATKAGVLDRYLLEQIAPFLKSVKPRKAVFDHNYVKRIDGPNVKKGK